MATETRHNPLTPTDRMYLDEFRKHGAISLETGLSKRAFAEGLGKNPSGALAARIFKLTEMGELLSNKNWPGVDANEFCYWLPDPSSETEE